MFFKTLLNVFYQNRFGDAVNTASRMESHGEGARIHLSYKTQALISDKVDLICESRGMINIKVAKTIDQRTRT